MTTIDVTRRSLPAATLATYRAILPTYAAERTLWDALIPALRAQGVRPIGPGGCIEHDEEFKEADVTESAFLEVAPGTQLAAPLIRLDAPARDIVVARVRGPYAQAIPTAHHAIAGHLAEHGLRPAWTTDDPATHVFNVYLTDPSTTAAADLLTEVCVPIA